MKIREHISHPIETLRSAPVGIVSMTFNGVAGKEIFQAFSESDSSVWQSLYVGIFSVNCLAVIMSGGLVKRQLDLKERLEHSIQENGYNDRIMEVTTGEWCNRQTARVVCGKSNNLAEYTMLCEDNRETMEHRWLPHF